MSNVMAAAIVIIMIVMGARLALSDDARRTIADKMRGKLGRAIRVWKNPGKNPGRTRTATVESWKPKTVNPDVETHLLSYWNICYSGKDGFLEYELSIRDEDGMYKIGRASSCNLILGDEKSVSHYHAYICECDGRMTLFDNGSANGVYVEDGLDEFPKRVDSVDICDGMTVYIGKAQLAFSAANPFRRPSSGTRVRSVV